MGRSQRTVIALAVIDQRKGVPGMLVMSSAHINGITREYTPQPAALLALSSIKYWYEACKPSIK